jgi:hypothetical protein
MSTYFTYVRVTESGTKFSDLQAVVQAWQPMQRVWSMTLAHFATTDSLLEFIRSGSPVETAAVAYLRKRSSSNMAVGCIIPLTLEGDPDASPSGRDYKRKGGNWRVCGSGGNRPCHRNG